MREGGYCVELPVRRGTTVMELLIGCAILSVATMTTSMFHTRISVIANSIKVTALARDALLNAREEIGTWTVGEVTQERVDSLRISDELEKVLPQAEWIVRIDEVEAPVAGLRIFLDLNWIEEGQARSASGITFWLTDDQPLSATVE